MCVCVCGPGEHLYANEPYYQPATRYQVRRGHDQAPLEPCAGRSSQHCRAWSAALVPPPPLALLVALPPQGLPRYMMLPTAPLGPAKGVDADEPDQEVMAGLVGLASVACIRGLHPWGRACSTCTRAWLSIRACRGGDLRMHLQTWTA